MFVTYFLFYYEEETQADIINNYVIIWSECTPKNKLSNPWHFVCNYADTKTTVM